MVYAKRKTTRRYGNRKPYKRSSYKRSPYARKSKTAMVSRRSPIVETKSFEHKSASVKLVTGTNVFIPKTFTQLENGTNEHNIIGRSIFSKYLTTKYRIVLTDLEGVTTPVSIESVFGWCKVPMNRTTITTPTLASTTYADIETHVAQQLNVLLASKLDFVEKQEGIKILERRMIMRKEDLTVSAADAPPKNADIYRQFTWKPMKKTAYESAVKNTELQQDNTHYPNRSWIPFHTFIVDGNVTETKTAYCVYNEKHWFSDS